MNKKKHVIVIVGPTASGKTELGLALKEFMDLEVISADSRQVYKFMDIGTAKPSKDELEQVTHHFIDFINPDEYFSAGLFAKLAEDKISDIILRGKIPVVIGGSGLYIKALFDGLFETDSNNPERVLIRETLLKKLTSVGKDELYEDLKKVDLQAALKYSDKNPVRVIRALEHFVATNQKFSDSQVLVSEGIYHPIYFGIEFEREVLYQRINIRSKQMWDFGIVDETENILKMGYDKALNSLNTVGYKECINYLDGIYSKDFAIEKMQQSTRNYAKRQVTWFKKVDGINWIKQNKSDKARFIADLTHQISSKNS